MNTSVDKEPTQKWRAGSWLAWSCSVAVHFAAALGASLFVLFGASSTCNHPATAANRFDGLRDLAVAAAILSVGWLAAALFTRSRWRRVTAGWLIGISPLLVVAATHLHTQDWSGGFCF